MKLTTATSILLLASSAVYGATTIDFEAQAAGSGSSFTGTANSPLTIGDVTLTGGELLLQEVGLQDQSGVYASEGVFGNESNPVTLQFSSSVAGVSLALWNGDAAQSYTITDNLGDSQTVMLPSAGAGGWAPVSFSGSGINWVNVISANANGWNFAIDDVTLSQAPEPASILLVTIPAALLFFRRSRRRASHDGVR